MLWLRNIYMLILMAVSGCGFQPLYGEASLSSDVVATLPSIDVHVNANATTDRRLAQFLETELTDLLNPRAEATEKLYRLDIDMTSTKSDLAIQQDATVTSFRLIVKAKYMLSYAPKRTLLKEGSVTNFGGFDQVDSQYATLISQKYGMEQLLKELAKRMQMKLIADFTELQRAQER